jgi:exopolysaccharide production protein ExoZ
MKIRSLQYIRAVAALSVCFYHAGYYVGYYRSQDAYLGAFGHDLGNFGVLTFFALSGFLMAVQCAKMELKPTTFLCHRIVRIYPLFWVACIVRIGIAWSSGHGGQFDPLTLMLAPVGTRNYVLGIEWTLVYEVAFYIYIFLVIAVGLRRWISVIASLWLLCIFVQCARGNPYTPQFLTSLMPLPLSSTCVPFAVGLLVPTLLRRRFITQGALPLGILIFGFASCGYAGRFGAAMMGVGCALIVAWGATLVDTSDTQSPALAKMGDWSYAIYLVHVPIITAVLMVGLDVLGATLAWWIVVAAAIAGGAAFGLFDIALYDRLKNLCDRLGARSRLVLCSAFFATFGGSMFLSGTNVLGNPIVPPGLGQLTNATTPGAVTVIMQRNHYLPDDLLRGSLDIIQTQGRGILVAGWVNDPNDPLNRVSMLLVNPGAFVVTALPRDYRGDVMRALGPRGFLVPSAFEHVIPNVSCVPGKAVYVVATSQRSMTYKELAPAICQQ